MDLPPGKADATLHWILLILPLAVLGLALMLRVQDGQQVLLPLIQMPLPDLCTFQRLLGLDCPGCGLTRSFISLAHGEPGRAWQYNPAGPLLFLAMLAQVPYRIVQLWRLRQGRQELQFGPLAYWLPLLLAAVLLGQWLTKTIGQLLWA